MSAASSIQSMRWPEVRRAVPACWSSSPSRTVRLLYLEDGVFDDRIRNRSVVRMSPLSLTRARAPSAARVVLVGIVAIVASVSICTPSASAAEPACGDIVVQATGWLAGSGVAVRSNGLNQGTGVSCAGESYADPAAQFGWGCNASNSPPACMRRRAGDLSTPTDRPATRTDLERSIYQRAAQPSRSSRTLP